MDEEYAPYLVWLETELREMMVKGTIKDMVVDSQMHRDWDWNRRNELEVTRLEMMKDGMKDDSAYQVLSWSWQPTEGDIKFVYTIVPANTTPVVVGQAQL